MYLLLDMDDLEDVKVVRNDVLIDADEHTKYFDEYTDAEEYGDRNLGDYLIVEVDI
jgi:hypothetical protein